MNFDQAYLTQIIAQQNQEKSTIQFGQDRYIITPINAKPEDDPDKFDLLFKPTSKKQIKRIQSLNGAKEYFTITDLLKRYYSDEWEKFKEPLELNPIFEQFGPNTQKRLYRWAQHNRLSALNGVPSAREIRNKYRRICNQINNLLTYYPGAMKSLTQQLSPIRWAAYPESNGVTNISGIYIPSNATNSTSDARNAENENIDNLVTPETLWMLISFGYLSRRGAGISSNTAPSVYKIFNKGNYCEASIIEPDINVLDLHYEAAIQSIYKELMNILGSNDLKIISLWKTEFRQGRPIDTGRIRSRLMSAGVSTFYCLNGERLNLPQHIHMQFMTLLNIYSNTLCDILVNGDFSLFSAASAPLLKDELKYIENWPAKPEMSLNEFGKIRKEIEELKGGETGLDKLGINLDDIARNYLERKKYEAAQANKENRSENNNNKMNFNKLDIDDFTPEFFHSEQFLSMSPQEKDSLLRNLDWSDSTFRLSMGIDAAPFTPFNEAPPINLNDEFELISGGGRYDNDSYIDWSVKGDYHWTIPTAENEDVKITLDDFLFNKKKKKVNNIFFQNAHGGWVADTKDVKVKDLKGEKIQVFEKTADQLRMERYEALKQRQKERAERAKQENPGMRRINIISKKEDNTPYLGRRIHMQNNEKAEETLNNRNQVKKIIREVEKLPSVDELFDNAKILSKMKNIEEKGLGVQTMALNKKRKNLLYNLYQGMKKNNVQLQDNVPYPRQYLISLGLTQRNIDAIPFLEYGEIKSETSINATGRKVHQNVIIFHIFNNKKSDYNKYVDLVEKIERLKDEHGIDYIDGYDLSMRTQRYRVLGDNDARIGKYIYNAPFAGKETKKRRIREQIALEQGVSTERIISEEAIREKKAAKEQEVAEEKAAKAKKEAEETAKNTGKKKINIVQKKVPTKTINIKKRNVINLVKSDKNDDKKNRRE